MKNKRLFLAIFTLFLILLMGCGLFGGFEPLQYSLILSQIGEGEVIISGNGQDNYRYIPGTGLILTAEPENGWFFSHWEDGLQGSLNPIGLTMDEDKEVTVVFLEQGQAWRYLYDGEHRIERINAVGLEEQGKWEAAVIIEPEEGDEFITRVSFYDAFEGATIKPKVFGSADILLPGDLLWIADEEYESKKAGWVEVTISDKIEITGFKYYWVVLEVDDPGAGNYPIGVANSNGFEERNKIKSEKEGIWKNLIDEDEKYDFNWLINILVEYK